MYYRNYTWVGNRISREDMARLYKLKMVTKRRITDMVAEAVKLYVHGQEAAKYLGSKQ